MDECLQNAKKPATEEDSTLPGSGQHILYLNPSLENHTHLLSVDHNLFYEQVNTILNCSYITFLHRRREHRG